MSKSITPELNKLIINSFYRWYICNSYAWCSLDKVIIADKEYIIKWYYNWWRWNKRGIEIEHKWVVNKWVFYINNDITAFIYNMISELQPLREVKISIEIEKIRTIMLWLIEMWIWEYERSQIALDLSECVAKLLKPETKLQRLLSFFKPKWK